MSYLIPTWEIAVGNKKDYRQFTAEGVVSQALFTGLARTRDELHLREIRPPDLGLQSWTTPPLPAHTINWVNCEMSGKAIGIYKVVQLSENPAVSEITFSHGEAVTVQHQLQQLYGLIPLLRKIKQEGDLEMLQIQYGLENLRMEGWFSEPIIYRPGSKVKIDLTSHTQGEGDTLILVGFVAERLPSLGKST